jgi:hypothetical protein
MLILGVVSMNDSNRKPKSKLSTVKTVEGYHSDVGGVGDEYG